MHIAIPLQDFLACACMGAPAPVIHLAAAGIPGWAYLLVLVLFLVVVGFLLANRSSGGSSPQESEAPTPDTEETFAATNVAMQHSAPTGNLEVPPAAAAFAMGPQVVQPADDGSVEDAPKKD